MLLFEEIGVTHSCQLQKEKKRHRFSWILLFVGFSRFSEDFSLMLGRQAPIYFKICLQYAGPIIIAVWSDFPQNVNMFQWQVGYYKTCSKSKAQNVYIMEKSHHLTLIHLENKCF